MGQLFAANLVTLTYIKQKYGIYRLACTTLSISHPDRVHISIVL